MRTLETVCLRCLLALAPLVVGCVSRGAQEPQREDDLTVFRNAWRDADAGDPDPSALSQLRHFEQAGISFDYPSPLRLSSGTLGGSGHSWKLTYGGFELNIYASRDATFGASKLIHAMKDALTDDAKPETPQSGRASSFCGKEVHPSRLTFNMFIDRNDALGYDLPAPEGEARVLLLIDALKNGEPSLVANATLAALESTLRCSTTGRPT